MSAKADSWTDERITELFRGMVTILLSNRPTLYSIPVLAPLAGNGGSRINNKTIQILRKMGESVGVANAQDIITSATKGGRPQDGREASKTPTPKKATPKKGSKKRKVESEGGGEGDAECELEEEEWEDIKPKMKPLV